MIGFEYSMAHGKFVCTAVCTTFVNELAAFPRYTRVGSTIEEPVLDTDDQGEYGPHVSVAYAWQLALMAAEKKAE